MYNFVHIHAKSKNLQIVQQRPGCVHLKCNPDLWRHTWRQCLLLSAVSGRREI